MEAEVLAAQLREALSERLSREGPLTDEEVRERISHAVFAGTPHEDNHFRRQVASRIFNAMRRLDVLQQIMDDPAVTEIMVNGPDAVFAERHGHLQKTDLRFESRERLEQVISVMVGQVNRTVNESEPVVDARLPDGSRVHVVMPPVALNGPVVTIRRFPEKPVTMEDLIRFGALEPAVARVLKAMVQCRYNIFVCGGTGSGKTTFLNVLSQYIDAEERIVTVEDAAELQIRTVENLVRLETRNANSEGRGAMGIRDLIRAALRMRPDRIVVGEVRGAEALDMLTAMNTGHDGSMSTGHANSGADMLSRLETMVLTAAELPLAAIRQQIASAVEIMIHLGRLRDKSRRVMSISEVCGYQDGQVIIRPLWEFSETGVSPEGRITGSLVRSRTKLERSAKAFRYGGHHMLAEAGLLETEETQ